MTEPEPYELPKFIIGAMSDEDCDYIIDKAKSQMTYSTLSWCKHTDIVIRVSENCFIPLKDDERILNIMKRHTDDIDKCEDLQVVRYRTGGYYRPHYDSAIYQDNIRVKTIMFGLNDGYDYHGGETIFPNLKEAFKLCKGDALSFKTIDSEGNIPKGSLHGGSDVIKGEKWICTLWIRKEKLTGLEEASDYKEDDYVFSQMKHDDIEEIENMEREVYKDDDERPKASALKRLIDECPDLTMVVRCKGKLVSVMYGGLVDGIQLTNEKINNLHTPDGDTLTIHSISVEKSLLRKKFGDFIARYYYYKWILKSKFKIKYYSVATRIPLTNWMKSLGFNAIGPSKISYGNEYWMDFFRFAPDWRT